jgi:type II secretory pathway pseudopilin PulG
MAAKADRSGAPFVVVAVAIVGLLSTIGAAALGGYWANRSVERQFESQRSAAIQDRRRETYANYLSATAQLCVVIGDDSTGQSQRTQQARVEVLNQDAQVQLIAGPGLRAPLTGFTQDLISDTPAACGDRQKYNEFRNAFVAGAQPDIR